MAPNKCLLNLKTIKLFNYREMMNMTNQTLQYTRLDDIDFFNRGKVRDLYDLGETLLVVSTDRISCFDVVLPTCIPLKGAVLTQLSVLWFEFTKDIILNHVLTVNEDDYPRELSKYKDVLKDRSMLVKKVAPIPVECVVRGYLAGSGWKEYKETHSVCGIPLPNGLKESSKLPEPIFTPATKEDMGHDVNVTQEYIEKEIGNEIATRLKEISISIYAKASAYAESRGIIIADTKFEFGMIDGEIILIDELITPDSSRFWPKDEYTQGKGQPSFDKQFVRDYLETLDWDKTPPAPQLPDGIVSKTSEKYLQAYRMISGKETITMFQQQLD